MLRKFLPLITLLACAAILYATPSISGKNNSPDTLMLAIKGEPAEGYDPILGWGLYGNPLFQSTLLKRDENLKIIPCLAKTSYNFV